MRERPLKTTRSKFNVKFYDNFLDLLSNPLALVVVVQSTWASIMSNSHLKCPKCLPDPPDDAPKFGIFEALVEVAKAFLLLGIVVFIAKNC